MYAKALLVCVVLVQCIYGLSAVPILNSPLAAAEFPYGVGPFGYANAGLGLLNGPFGYDGIAGPFGYDGFAGPYGFGGLNTPLAYDGFVGPYGCGALNGFNGAFGYGPYATIL